jgi:hypothetical protein
VWLHVQAGWHEGQLLQHLHWQPFADSTSNISQRIVRLARGTGHKHSCLVVEQALFCQSQFLLPSTALEQVL